MAGRGFKRTDRVAAQLRRDVGALVHQAVRDHGLPSVSVSDVEVSRDLAHANVYITALLPDSQKLVIPALKEHAKELRMQLAKAMRLRHVPELHFFYDESVDRGEKMDAILRDVLPDAESDDESDDV